MIITGGQQSLIMTTTHQRTDELIKYIGANAPDPNYDLVVTSPATGNKEYIEWVKTQCSTREAEIVRESAKQKKAKEEITQYGTM